MIEIPLIERARQEPETTFHLGIMGGTFDPIHFGHLVTAEQAREAFHLDEVLFMPTNDPIRKQGKQVTPARTRLEMVELAVRSNSFFSSSDLEIARGGVTYTVDTLDELRDLYPDNVVFYFITGADAVLDILTWRDASRIASTAVLIGATRPGYDLESARKQHEASGFRFDVRYLEIPALAISSTDLRTRVSQGKSIRYLTPGIVLEFIREEGLYR